MKTINPNFDDLNNPEIIKNHVQELTNHKADDHSKILGKLINEIKPVDFEVLAFPQLKKLKDKLEKTEAGSDDAKAIQKQIDKLTVKQKHFIILSVENILKYAENKRWGLCKNHDFIYLYNSNYWNELDKETFQKFLGEASEKMGVTKFDARFFQFREKLYKQFLATAYLPTPENDKNKVFINLLNGTFEINSNGTKLRPFKYSDFLTYQLPFEYDPKAKAPIFEKYLDEVLPDKARQKILAEYLGYVFIKHGSNRLKEEKALILYGTGANGKSVFYEKIQAIFLCKALQTITAILGQRLVISWLIMPVK
jgi:putative DNA primase/helicase